ncbi:MAG: hypothetical protein H6833_14185 [Planctomycetes bacterium]|nr:hypothetical protein [Planctomycetota bacterium]
MKNTPITTLGSEPLSTAQVLAQLLSNPIPGANADFLQPVWRVQTKLEEQAENDTIELTGEQWKTVQGALKACTLPNLRQIDPIINRVDAYIKNGGEDADPS